MNCQWAHLILVVVTATGLSSGCSRRSEAGSESGLKKVVVIGFDGMDPRMCERMMEAGRLPNLTKMRDLGGFRPLGTSMPPQSPVAWSNFITGAGPGVHGIFDFIHRDPSKQCAPYYSAAETVDGEGGWEVGEHKLPLDFWPFEHKPTETLLRRRGTPFWDYLDAAGIPVRLYDIPSNYPPSPSQYGNARCLAGMGVPDLSGSLGGTYQYFAEDVDRVINEDGGIRKGIRFVDGRATGLLLGPENTYVNKDRKPVATAEFVVYRHPSEPSARIELQGQTVLLKQGEWSDWQRVRFDLEMPPFLPKAPADGICRFYLRQVHPVFQLYVSPVNIDPSEPGGQRVTEPPDFIEQISDELGLFATLGFQEAYKALVNDVFTDPEYLEQASQVLDERLDLLEFARREYQDGFLFFYFSSTDLQAHMFWWDSDQEHPTRSREEAKRYHGIIERLYESMDKVVGDVLDEYGDEALVMVMSDHGFGNFKRQFNLNTWLRDNGYIAPNDCTNILKDSGEGAVNWSKTKAYALGLNGVYLNLRGREKLGIVASFERDALLREISARLLEVRDPADGRPVIKTVYRAEEIYAGPELANAPDLLIGFHRDYRAAWAGTLGEMTDEVIFDNKSAWSADHCIAADEVPGVIFANRAILRDQPTLIDLAPTILQEFGVSKPMSMRGESLFRGASKAQRRSSVSTRG